MWIKHHVVKTYEDVQMNLDSLNLCTRWKWMVSFMLQLFCTKGKQPSVPTTWLCWTRTSL